MNSLAFEGGERGRKFDANFASRLDPKRGEFEYFVQRLVGREIEREDDPKAGRMWLPYVNRLREDWTFICENNRIVSKEDDIVFRFEAL